MIFIVVSTGHFDPLIEECEKIKSEYEFLGQIGSGTFVPSFSHFRTSSPQVLEENMRKAELVITHAGTGMLSMLYYLQKKCVVIPKQIRYGESNDGQVELALKWAELGLGILCLDVRQLKEKIEKCRNSSITSVKIPSLGQALAIAMTTDSATYTWSH